MRRYRNKASQSFGNSSTATVPTSNAEANARFEELVQNVLMMRTEMMKQLIDPRRDLDDECGYPKGWIPTQVYQDLFDREPIANRVVSLYPQQCWQAPPTIVEDDNPMKLTPFEEDWDALDASILSEPSWHEDEEISTIWSYLLRADIQSGIGRFGILLIGFDDGMDLSTPIVDQEMVNNRVSSNKKMLKLFQLVQNERPGVKADASGNPLRYDPMTGQFEGTFAQYQPLSYGQFSNANGTQTGELDPKKKRKGKLGVQYLRVYPETMVQITQWESNPHSPRYGKPLRYNVTLNDFRDQVQGVGLPLGTVSVHWTRVIHLAEHLNASEHLAAPRMEACLNPILDIKKIRGSSGEMFYKGGFPGFALSTHPQLGGDVNVDYQSLKDNIELYQNGLQRFLMLMGMGVQSMAPQVSDPKSHIETAIEAICIVKCCPVRVFKGSERGELASSQDDGQWNDQLRCRNRTYTTPRVIAPLVNRLISVGVLREPKSWKTKWPDFDSLTQKDKAAIAVQKTGALSQYVQSGVSQVMVEEDFLTEVMGLSQDRAAEILENAAEAMEAKAEEQAAQQEAQAQAAMEQGFNPAPPQGFEHPADRQQPPSTPVKLREGEALVDPNKGEEIVRMPSKSKTPTKNDLADNSNPEGCNQYTGPGCGTGIKDDGPSDGKSLVAFLKPALEKAGLGPTQQKNIEKFNPNGLSTGTVKVPHVLANNPKMLAAFKSGLPAGTKISTISQEDVKALESGKLKQESKAQAPKEVKPPIEAKPKPPTKEPPTKPLVEKKEPKEETASVKSEPKTVVKADSTPKVSPTKIDPPVQESKPAETYKGGTESEYKAADHDGTIAAIAAQLEESEKAEASFKASLEAQYGKDAVDALDVEEVMDLSTDVEEVVEALTDDEVKAYIKESHKVLAEAAGMKVDTDFPAAPSADHFKGEKTLLGKDFSDSKAAKADEMLEAAKKGDKSFIEEVTKTSTSRKLKEYGEKLLAKMETPEHATHQDQLQDFQQIKAGTGEFKIDASKLPKPPTFVDEKFKAANDQTAKKLLEEASKGNAQFLIETVATTASSKMKEYAKSLLDEIEDQMPQAPLPEGVTKDQKLKLSESSKGDSKAIDAWYKDLTDKQSSSVSSWAGSGYKDIRKSISSGEPTDKAKDFLSAMEKAPKYQGTVYRGLHGEFSEKQMQAFLTAGVGGEFIDTAPHSMSRSPSASHSFGGGKLMLIIDTKTGRSLEQHGLSGEKEIVGMPKTRYRIKAIHKDPNLKMSNTKHKYKMAVHLEEI